MSANSKIYLAFDVGLSRTGVAVANTISQSARAAGSINVINGRHDWNSVDLMIAQWQPNAIVLGAGSPHDPALGKAINRLESHLQKQHKLRVYRVDESFTTVAANRAMTYEGVAQSKRKELRDQYAACIILDNWLATH